MTFAQKAKKQIVSVKGEYTVLESSSPLAWRQAPQKAREDAQKKAIEKVCGSTISVWDVVEMSSAGESYNSLTAVQTDGEIIDFKIIREGVYQSKIRQDETIFYCEAEVTVKSGVQPDPNFVAEIQGLKSIYYEGDELVFTVKPYQDCYLKVFVFSDATTAQLLYPSDLEQSFKLQALKTARFPIDSIIYGGYTLLLDTDDEFETNRLMFVFTKDERPFYQVTASGMKIMEWIALIPNNQKYLYAFTYDIRRK